MRKISIIYTLRICVVVPTIVITVKSLSRSIKNCTSTSNQPLQQQQRLKSDVELTEHDLNLDNSALSASSLLSWYIKSPEHELQNSTIRNMSVTEDVIASITRNHQSLVKEKETLANAICKETLSQPLARVRSRRANSFFDFMMGPALEKERKTNSTLLTEYTSKNDGLVLLNAYDNMSTKDEAACLFRHEAKHSNHFPHAMQQLYRCISWWFAHPGIPWVLIFDKSLNESKGKSSPFLNGFLDAIEHGLGVRIVQNYTGAYVRDSGFQTYVMQNPETDAASLRDTLLKHYNILSIVEKDFNSTQDIPRLAILNRRNTDSRNIMNVQQLSQSLTKELTLLQNNKSNDNDNQNGSTKSFDIHVDNFQNKSFVEQITFFASHDIIISPHGAQLTGIPFMPDCGVILELIPENYYLPHYFGTLANVSNLIHAFLYLSGTNDGPLAYAKIKSDKASRRRAARSPLCPPIEMVTDSVKQLIEEWKQCRTKLMKRKIHM